MFIVSITIRFRSDKIDIGREIISKFKQHALTEPGCIHYELFHSINKPEYFKFFMKWKDEASFRAHANQPYIKAFDDRYDELREFKNEVLYLENI